MTELTVEGFHPSKGVHADTAAIAAAVTHGGHRLIPEGVEIEAANRSHLDEAMILGIGGGLGAGYILWEFKKHDAAIPVFGFRNNWQYPVKFVEAVAERLKLTIDLHETGGAKGAQTKLEEALDAGRPAVVWVEPFSLGYLQVSEMFKGCFGHVVTVYGLDSDNDRVLVADRAETPFEIPGSALAAARKGIGSYKHRLLSVAPAEQEGTVPEDLDAACRAGLADAAAHLARPSDSFSLPVIRKWSKMTTDPKNKKGWPKVLAGGRGLFGMLAAIYENVLPLGLHGGNLRSLYARFLDQAGAITGLDLSDPADRYRALDEQWRALAEAALPDDVEPLAAVRRLIDRQAAVRSNQGGAGVEELIEIRAELDDLAALHTPIFELGSERTTELFEDLGQRLAELFEAEVEANRALSAAI